MEKCNFSADSTQYRANVLSRTSSWQNCKWMMTSQISIPLPPIPALSQAPLAFRQLQPPGNPLGTPLGYFLCPNYFIPHFFTKIKLIYILLYPLRPSGLPGGKKDIYLGIYHAYRKKFAFYQLCLPG